MNNIKYRLVATSVGKRSGSNSKEGFGNVLFFKGHGSLNSTDTFDIVVL